MKSFSLKSKIRLNEFHEVKFLSSIQKSSFIDVRFTSKQDSGGLKSLTLRSFIHDSSRSVGLKSRILETGNSVYGIVSRVAKLGSSTQSNLRSKVKLSKYKEFRLVSRVETHGVGTVRFKSSFIERGVTSFRFKSLVHKKPLSQFTFKSKITVLSADRTVNFPFRSSFRTYVSPVSSQKKIREGIKSIPANFKMLSGISGGVKGAGIGIFSNIVEERGEVKSATLRFEKDSTLTIGGVRHFFCHIETSLMRRLNGVRTYGLGLIGVFGTLGGVRSNSIQFSIRREIIDFDKTKVTAVRLGIIASDLDLSLSETQMKINFGSGLFLVSRSVYNRILHPFLPKVEDDSLFNVESSSQQISVTSKATLFDTEKSNQRGISTDIAESKLPSKTAMSVMPNILFGSQSTSTVKLRSDSGIRAVVRGGASELARHTSKMLPNWEVDVLNRWSYQSAKVDVSDKLPVSQAELFKMSESSSLINSGNFIQTVLPGEEYTREVYVFDADGNVTGTEVLNSRKITLAGARGDIHLVSTHMAPVFNGLRCGIHGVIKTGVIIPSMQFRHIFTIMAKRRYNYNGIRSLRSKITIVFTQDRNGIQSNLQAFSANKMFILPRIIGHLRFKVN